MPLGRSLRSELVDSPGAGAQCLVCGSVRTDHMWTEGEWVLLQCAACDLVFVGNPPDAERLADLYSFEAGFHDELTGASATAAADRVAARHLGRVAAEAPGRLLDVGCASGRFLLAARSSGWEVSGVDLNDDTADLARQHELDVKTGTIDDLDPETRFDVITMWDVVEHVLDPVALLSSANRLLAPGGRLFITTPNVDGLFPRASYLVASKVGRWPHPEPPYHLSQFSDRTLRTALMLAGMQATDVRHGRIPISYTFGRPAVLARDPRRLAYTAVFAPLALGGPLLGRGDEILVTATSR